MPVDERGQFQYPKDNWSTGTMRKAGDMPDYPPLSPEELAAWSAGMAQQGKSYGFEKHQPWNPDLADTQGALVQRGHPQFEEMKKTHDIFTIPRESQPNRPGFEWLFVKPKEKPALVSKMLPTASEASRVLETAAGRQKSKRKEAEAM